MSDLSDAEYLMTVVARALDDCPNTEVGLEMQKHVERIARRLEYLEAEYLEQQQDEEIQNSWPRDFGGVVDGG